MKTYEMELVIKDCPTLFKEGFLPGGFAKQVVTFDATEEDALRPLFLAAVSDAMNEFLRNTVEVRIKEIADVAMTEK